jgi:hypothetical protein
MEPVQCIICKHYRGAKTCDAYKTAIPDEIYIDGFDHTKPFKGDHGIRFEPIKEGKDVLSND